MADFTPEDINPKDPNEMAVARAPAPEADVEGRSGMEAGSFGGEIAETL